MGDRGLSSYALWIVFLVTFILVGCNSSFEDGLNNDSLTREDEDLYQCGDCTNNLDDESKEASPACGPVPGNVTVISDWLGQGTTNSVRYSLRDETKSFAFTTTNGGVTAGRLETAYTSSNPRTRSTWISKCPGGPPLDQRFRGTSLCENTAYEVTIIGWSDLSVERICQLLPNARYYLNVRSADAWDALQGNCDAINCGFFGRNTVQ